MNTRAVTLLAGLGSRLGRPHPKPLTPLADGETILARQVRILTQFGLPVTGVVGFKMDIVMESAPELLFAYNPNYDTTNTAKSLLCALRHNRGEDILWLNGDVVFEPEIIERVLECTEPTVVVNDSRVGEEEVKYTLDDDGYINRISKQVIKARGEALGINFIPGNWVPAFVEKLAEVDDQDYFERAMELLIDEKGQVFRALDVADVMCMEVDFDNDLEAVNRLLSSSE